MQQVDLARRELRGEQYDPTGPGGVFVDDVPDDQAFLVRFGHHLRGDVPDVFIFMILLCFSITGIQASNFHMLRFGQLFDRPERRFRTFPRSTV
jgi:hypothetical protein